MLKHTILMNSYGRDKQPLLELFQWNITDSEDAVYLLKAFELGEKLSSDKPLAIRF